MRLMGTYSIVTKNLRSVNKITHIFWLPRHILLGMSAGEVETMRECDDYSVDLEDLIYDEDGGYPSER